MSIRNHLSSTWSNGIFTRFRQLAQRTGISMDDALARLEQTRVSLPPEIIASDKLIEAFLEEKRAKGRRAKTIEHYERMLRFFAKSFSNTSIRQIQPVDVLNWAEKRYDHPESQTTSPTPIFCMFRWAASPHRQYVDSQWTNRVAKTERILSDRKQPRVFQPSELQGILKAEPNSIVPVLALGAFAGIRPEELISESKEKKVLNWENRSSRTPGNSEGSIMSQS